MKVEIWSDVVCPWCYIGKRRFERALADFDGAADIEVQWRSFQLNPDQPRGVRATHDEYLAAKMGASIDQVHQLNARVVALAAEEGLEYHFETYQVINTFDAHRVAHLARANGFDDPAQERLLRAQLVEGEVLDDADTLARLGGEIGLDPADVRRSSRRMNSPRTCVTISQKRGRWASTACRSSPSTGGSGCPARSPPRSSSTRCAWPGPRPAARRRSKGPMRPLRRRAMSPAASSGRIVEPMTEEDVRCAA